MALLPPMLQSLFGYPVVTVGMVLAPRGIGTHGLDDGRRPPGPQGRSAHPRRLRPRPDRLFALADDLFLARDDRLAGHRLPASSRASASASCSSRCRRIAFITLDPRLRTEATSLFNLVRNLGSSDRHLDHGGDADAQYRRPTTPRSPRTSRRSTTTSPAAGIIPALLRDPGRRRQAARSSTA